MNFKCNQSQLNFGSSINDYNEVISLIAIQEDGENLLKFFSNVTFLARLESSIQARNSSVYVDSFMAMKGKDFVGKAPRQNAVLETEVPTVLNYSQYLSLGHQKAKIPSFSKK